MNTACGCCEGIEILTPLDTVNRPGLDALAVRIGTYASFLETMKARLSSLCLGPVDLCNEGQGVYPLADLTVRADDDPAIAILHGWAAVADVLTFYQERIANEGYLRTAREYRSILELARLIGYRPRPGVAASVHLAFELENDFSGDIPKGTRAQSLPEPGQMPQFFETGETVPGKGAWNSVAPRSVKPQWISSENADSMDTLYFEGIDLRLQPNDPLLLLFKDDSQYFGKIKQADSNVQALRTDVTISLYDLTSTGIAPAKIVDGIRTTLGRCSNLEEFGINPNTQMAGRVVNAMKKIKTAVSGTAASTEIRNILAEVLVDLREEHAIAIEGAYRKLSPWVGGLVADLEGCEQRLIYHHRKPRTSGTAGWRCAPPDSPEKSIYDLKIPAAADNLFSLIAPLSKVSDKQPDHASGLVRTPADVFTLSADTLPKLVKTFNPQLQDNLFQAWANTQVVQPAERGMHSLHALRTKASPFGHNAPLRPITDNHGRVTGHEEWPLTTAMLGVTLSNDKDELGQDHFNTPLQAMLSVTHNGKTARTREEIQAVEETRDVVVGEFKIVIKLEVDSQGPVLSTSSAADPLLMRIAITWLDQKIDLAINEGIMRIAADGFRIFLRSGHSDTRHDAIHQRTINVHFSDNADTFNLAMEMAPVELADELRELLNGQVSLDTEYAGIKPDSWAVIERADKAVRVARHIESVETVSMAQYGLTGKATRLVFSKDVAGGWIEADDTSLAALRNTTIHVESGDPVTLSQMPIHLPVEKQTVVLDGLYEGLTTGRWVVVSGERIDTGIRDSELMMIAAVTHGPHAEEISGKTPFELPGDTPHTTLHFAGDGLKHAYRRDTVTIQANVVGATHGETREEVLGSGDATQVYQTFALQQSPLTHLAAPTPAGAQNTLQVSVDDILWYEQETFLDMTSQDRGFVTRTDDIGSTTVIFGNGGHGARPPTGSENIRAVYRFGMGRMGNVAAQKISQLATRPQGVKGVVNPLPATGGADRESRDQARRNAPSAVMALDRLVSVRDYADFSCAFAGIGKAHAARLSNGYREVVHVTIAGADDVPIDADSDLCRNLVRALHRFGDPYLPVEVALRQLIVLVVKARVRIDPDYLWEKVQPGIIAALLDRFGFDARQLGQDALLGEVIQMIQAVPGVLCVDVDVFDGIRPEEAADATRLAIKFASLAAWEYGLHFPTSKKDPAGGIRGAARPSQPRKRIRADMARFDDQASVILPAQLAVFDPDLSETIMIEEIGG